METYYVAEINNRYYENDTVVMAGNRYMSMVSIQLNHYLNVKGLEVMKKPKKLQNDLI